MTEGFAIVAVAALAVAACVFVERNARRENIQLSRRCKLLEKQRDELIERLANLHGVSIEKKGGDGYRTYFSDGVDGMTYFSDGEIRDRTGKTVVPPGGPKPEPALAGDDVPERIKSRMKRWGAEA